MANPTCIQAYQIPGPRGPKGNSGLHGDDGLDARTTVTAEVNIPNVGELFLVEVEKSGWAAVGQPVFIEIVGSGFKVNDILDGTHLELTNIGASDNAVPGTTIPIGAAIVPSGMPGQDGADGADGADGVGVAGTNGQSAFSATTANFAVPAVGAKVTIAVGNSDWTAVGLPLFIENAGGGYTVTSKPDSTHIEIENLGTDDNAAPATNIASGSVVTPGGFQGVAGENGLAVQVVEATSTAIAAVTGIIPFDDTTPESGEGTELLTLNITPLAATNRLYIEVDLGVSAITALVMTGALFRNAEIFALAASFQQIPNTSLAQFRMSHQLQLASGAALTIKLRIGSATGAEIGVNGYNGGAGVIRKYGGVMRARLRVTEYTV